MTYKGEVGWRANIKHRYGITSDQYFEMLDRQNGVCAICGGDNGGRRLAVDHEHASGRVRGLLCFNCNHLLGKAQDSVSVLERAITYLQEL